MCTTLHIETIRMTLCRPRLRRKIRHVSNAVVRAISIYIFIALHFAEPRSVNMRKRFDGRYREGLSQAAMVKHHGGGALLHGAIKARTITGRAGSSAQSRSNGVIVIITECAFPWHTVERTFGGMQNC